MSLRYFGFVIFLSAAAPAFGQPGADPAVPDQTVVLNPFVVNTSGDVGYLAQSSVSGSRLNTNLADLAAPVTAFTAEFLQDVGITNVDDLTTYMVNARMNTPEGNNLYFDGDSQGFLVRGLPASTYAVNFFPTTLRLDLFNASRVDESRGPNSILFGLGSPGGLVNVSTNRAVLNKSFGKVGEQAGSYSKTRTTLDYNWALVPNKLSLRFDAVRDHRDTFRTREYDNSDRVYLAAGWQIDHATRLDLEFEHGMVHKSLVQPMTILDGITSWIALGSHLGNAANAAQGLVSLGATSRNTIDTATGVLEDYKNTTTSVQTTAAGTAVWLTDFKLVPKDVAMLAGPMSYQDTNYTQGSVFLTHDFTPDLTFEGAAWGQKFYHTAMAPRDDILRVDTNTTLPSGAANPNAGKPYVDYRPITTDEYDKRQAVRFTGSYVKNLGDWWGRHVFAALFQKDWTRMRSNQLLPVNVTTPQSTTLVSAANELYFRSYIDLNGPKDQMAIGDWRPFLIHPAGSAGTYGDNATTFITNPRTGYKMGVKWVGNAVGADNWFTQDSAMYVMQNHWLKDRLVTVLGYRQDRENSWYSESNTALAQAPPAPGFTTGEYIQLHDTPPLENNAYNLTYSALLKVLDPVAVFYDHSRNSALPDPNAFVINPDNSTHPPQPHGLSDDVGVKVNLGQRLSFSALYYKTSATNSVANSNATIETVFSNIWTSLNQAGVTGPNGENALNVPQKFNRYTFDSRAHGYEVELIANPTPNWRIFGNFSETVVTQSNIGALSIAYYNRYSPYWLKNGNVPYTTVVGQTVAQAVASLAQNINNLYVITNGQQGRGQGKYQANLIPVYEFTTGPLKGVWAGSGVQYRSAPIVDYEVGAAGGAPQVYYGKANWLVNPMIGYKSRFRRWDHEFPWSIQLNVSNALDNTQILPTRELSGAIVTYAVQPPVQFLVTTQIGF